LKRGESTPDPGSGKNKKNQGSKAKKGSGARELGRKSAKFVVILGFVGGTSIYGGDWLFITHSKGGKADWYERTSKKKTRE